MRVECRFRLVARVRRRFSDAEIAALKKTRGELQSPAREILHGRDADIVRAPLREGRTREARLARETLERPRLGRPGMNKPQRAVPM